MDGGGFIRDLCVALEYRWKPDATFLLFIAHFDESDTHGQEPHMIMSAFLGTARQWELVGRKINALGKQHGFTIFHSYDLRNSKGEFKGWSLRKKLQLVDELASIIRGGLKDGVTAILPRSLYIEEYRGKSKPKGMHLDTQYGVCFRMCMKHLMNLITEDGRTHMLHVIIEGGHKNVRDTVRVFDELKMETVERGIKILGTITVARKSECAGLAAVDFLAHGHYLSESRVRAGAAGYYEMASPRQPSNYRGAMTTQLEMSPETFAGLKAEWQDRKDERIRKWREARNAKRASSDQRQGDG
jgi:hypothetical protein